MKVLEKPFLFTYSVMQKKMVWWWFIDSVNHQHCTINFITVFFSFFLQIPCGYFDMQDLITPNTWRKLTP